MWSLPLTERGTGAYSKYGISLVPAGTPVVPATYDAAGLTTALTTASSGSKLVRLDANLTLASNVTVPADVSLFSASAVSVSGTGKLVLNSRSKVIGLKFVGAATIAITFETSNGITGAIIACCDFMPAVSNSTAIKDESTANNSLHSGVSIVRNYFNGHEYAVFGVRSTAFVVEWNECVNSKGRNIQFSGGKNHLIRYNRIDSGVTGISFLLDAQYGTYAADCHGNQITGNWLKNITEEAISADIFGNNATSVSVRDQFVINSKQGSYNSNPEFVVNRAARMFPANRSIVFVTGGAAGKCARLVYDDTVVASTTIYLRAANDQLTSSDFAAVQAGDVVTVAHTFVDSVIERNRIEITTTNAVGIYLYGNSFRNRVSSNVISHLAGNDAIRIDSLNGLMASNDGNRNTTTSTQCAPSSDNIVSHNTISVGKITIRGYSYDSEANSFPATYRNVVRNNAVGLVISDKWTGNSGATVFTTFVADCNDGSLETNNAALPTDAVGGRLPVGSALTAGGVYIGSITGFDGKTFQNPPSIGAYEYIRPRTVRTTFNPRT